MRRGESCGFRLGNIETQNLTWLFTQSDAEISGLAGQGYEPRMSSDTSPEHLFLQERLVSFHGDDRIERQNRLRAIARRMASDDKVRGCNQWQWLQRVYGPLSLKDPHDHFGRELAPLVRLTPSALERAEKRWPHWHTEKHAKRYESLQSQLRKAHGEGADIERMMNLMPDSAQAAGEQEEILSFVIDGACERSRESKRPMTDAKLSPADESFLEAIERQADGMLAQAGLAFQAAVDKVDEEIAEESRRGRIKKDVEHANDGKLLAARAAEALLNIEPKTFKSLFRNAFSNDEEEFQ